MFHAPNALLTRSVEETSSLRHHNPPKALLLPFPFHQLTSLFSKNSEDLQRMSKVGLFPFPLPILPPPSQNKYCPSNITGVIRISHEDIENSAVFDLA